MPKTSRTFLFAILILSTALLSRALFLEFTNLVDPTEARYAAVAQRMVLDNDWLTPMVPMPEGLVPYLGKPPLHFWLTALSYKIFGVDEWSSRLPSFCSAILILFTIYIFGCRYFSKEIAISACLIAISSSVFFFVAGASITDVTLTAMISAAVLCLYIYNSELNSLKRYAYLAAIFSALGFLCKGPIAVVLIALPFLLSSLIRKDFRWLRRLPWISCITIFIAVNAPWFILSEIKNPGFLKYFFWNENIARYLLKDYGDKFGSGHVHAYGTSWLMLIGVAFPWSIFLAIASFKSRRKSDWSWLTSNKDILFCFCWGISVALFFTFVRQLHMLYVLPGIPGLSLLTAKILSVFYKEHQDKMQTNWNKVGTSLTLIIAATFMVAGFYLEAPLFSFLICFLAISFSLALLFKLKSYPSFPNFISSISCAFICNYLIGIAVVTPFVNESRSSEEVLKQITKIHSKDKSAKVGIVSRNSFSHYWASAAWPGEIGQKVDLVYVPILFIPIADVEYLLAKPRSVPLEALKNYEIVGQNSQWALYRKLSTSANSDQVP